MNNAGKTVVLDIAELTEFEQMIKNLEKVLELPLFTAMNIPSETYGDVPKFKQSIELLKERMGQLILKRITPYKKNVENFQERNKESNNILQKNQVTPHGSLLNKISKTLTLQNACLDGMLQSLKDEKLFLEVAVKKGIEGAQQTIQYAEGVNTGWMLDQQQNQTSYAELLSTVAWKSRVDGNTSADTNNNVATEAASQNIVKPFG